VITPPSSRNREQAKGRSSACSRLCHCGTTGSKWRTLRIYCLQNGIDALVVVITISRELIQCVFGMPYHCVKPFIRYPGTPLVSIWAHEKYAWKHKRNRQGSQSFTRCSSAATQRNRQARKPASGANWETHPLWSRSPMDHTVSSGFDFESSHWP